MNFDESDIKIIIAMSIAVIGLSFTLPALGMVDSADTSQPPNFTMQESRFDFSGDFPNNPGTPAQGSIDWVADVGVDGDFERYLEEGGDEAWLTAEPLNVGNDETEPGATFTVYNSTTDTFKTNSTTTTTEGSAHTFEQSEEGWKVRVTFTSIEDVADGWDFTLRYEVIDRPESGGSFISSIPVVGGLFSAGEALASTVAWLGSVVWWGVTWVFEISANLLGLIADLMIFGIGTLTWLSGNYAAVISAASGWASLVLAVPSLLIALELGKLVMVVISLLPTT